MVTALLGPRCPVPVVVADDVPTWVGALDVVLAHTEDPGDVRMAESVDRAARRGARVLLTAGPDGPVAASAAQHAPAHPAARRRCRRASASPARSPRGWWR